jgi:hypothetical protein
VIGDEHDGSRHRPLVDQHLQIASQAGVTSRRLHPISRTAAQRSQWDDEDQPEPAL